MQQMIDSLKQKYRQAGLTQVQFAQRFGISQATLSRLYNGQRRIGITTLTRIIEAYPDLAPLFLPPDIRSGNETYE